jgi:signal transduction histidine kinase
MNEEMESLNLALKREVSEKQPQVWQARAAVELVHDLANPLTVMIGYASLLVQEAQSFTPEKVEPVEKIRNYADVVSRAAEYCHHLADNWKRTSRHATEFITLDLVNLVREVKEVIFFNNSAIQISGLGSAQIQGSGFELTRVFQNVFKNALEAGATRVAVVFAQNGGTLEVAVIDNGSGMDAETSIQALKGGFTTKAHGTGLGLGICRHLLGVHGATLSLESELNRGTTLRMGFPATVGQ